MGTKPRRKRGNVAQGALEARIVLENSLISALLADTVEKRIELAKTIRYAIDRLQNAGDE